VSKHDQSGSSGAPNAPPAFQMSAHWTVAPGQQQPSLPQIDPRWVQAASIREEYRAERESEMRADLDASLAAAKAATDFAQSVLKAGFWLNGGGMIAIPAIVTLFKLDAPTLFWMLLSTGAAFIVGLLVTWIASLCGFFALANRSDSAYNSAVRTARNLEAKYFPFAKAEMEAQARAAESTAKSFAVKFLRLRRVAIVLCFVAMMAFIVGVGFGAYAVVRLQQSNVGVPASPPQATAPSLPLSPPVEPAKPEPPKPH
jgi:hypothetical protein